MAEMQTTIKERPMLYAGSMVRALLAGELDVSELMARQLAANQLEQRAQGFDRGAEWQFAPAAELRELAIDHGDAGNYWS